LNKPYYVGVVYTGLTQMLIKVLIISDLRAKYWQNNASFFPDITNNIAFGNHTLFAELSQYFFVG